MTRHRRARFWDTHHPFPKARGSAAADTLHTQKKKHTNYTLKLTARTKKNRRQAPLEI